MDPTMKLLALVGVIGLIIIGVAGALRLSSDAQVDIEAAKAGLVQQVVKVPGYAPYIIWVKPPAPSYVERPEK